MNAENRSAQLIRPSRHTKPRIPAKLATSFHMTTIPALLVSKTNVEVWVNVIPMYSIVIIHCIHQQNKYSHHILKCVDIALLSSKNTFPCCENEFIGNT
jgi:hypothetical protein